MNCEAISLHLYNQSANHENSWASNVVFLEIGKKVYVEGYQMMVRETNWVFFFHLLVFSFHFCLPHLNSTLFSLQELQTFYESNKQEKVFEGKTSLSTDLWI